ncbi:MAG: hypothetical protein P9L98_05340 [Candidatus Kaelpia imicola]|nr:hypothetical protein [Candidatus Kaelpia imicola]
MIKKGMAGWFLLLMFIIVGCYENFAIFTNNEDSTQDYALHLRRLKDSSFQFQDIAQPDFFERNWERLRDGIRFQSSSGILIEIRRNDEAFVMVCVYNPKDSTQMTEAGQFVEIYNASLDSIRKIEQERGIVNHYQVGVPTNSPITPAIYDFYSVTNLTEKEFNIYLEGVRQVKAGSIKDTYDIVDPDLRETAKILATDIAAEIGGRRLDPVLMIASKQKLIEGLEIFLREYDKELFGFSFCGDSIKEQNIFIGGRIIKIGELEELALRLKQCKSYLEGDLGNLFYRSYLMYAQGMPIISFR